MMTRKDYVTTARILHEYKQDMSEAMFRSMVAEFSGYFASDNPKFQRDKFVDAAVNGSAKKPIK